MARRWGSSARDAECVERLLTALERGDHLGAEALPGEGRPIDTVEPNGPLVTDLVVERQAGRLHREMEAGRLLAMPHLEPLEEVGRHVPHVG